MSQIKLLLPAEIKAIDGLFARDRVRSSQLVILTISTSFAILTLVIIFSLLLRSMRLAVQVIEPEGILDGTKTDKFRQEINESVKTGANIILVDFTNVTFMDSSGLGALVLSLKTIRSADAKLFICSINEQIKMLFELTSMDRVFEIFASREEFEEKVAKLS